MEATEQQNKQEYFKESSRKSIVDLNDDCLEEIFSYFSIEELVELDKVCPRFRNVADEYFYRKQEVLEIFRDRHSSAVVADLAERVGPHVTTLRISIHIHYDSFQIIRNIGFFRTLHVDYLKPLWIHCINLEHLITKEFELGVHLEFLKTVFKNLKSVKLINCELTDEIGEYLKTASKLESLSLRGNFMISGSILPALKDQLKEIDLRGCTYVLEGPYFGQFCRKNLKLESLLFDFPSDWVIEYLDELKNLRCLRIEKVWVAISSPKVLGLPKLTLLEISGIANNDWNALINHLGNSLEYLNICLIIFRNIEYIDFLPKMTKLKVFKVMHYCFKDSDLLSMNTESRKTLEHLEISGSNEITDEGLLKCLKDCPNIRKLGIFSCWNITDALIIGLLPILKERPHTLEIYTRGTGISKSIEKKLQLQENRKFKLNWTYLLE
ncbi:uncharacterized protein DMENIID0001_028620 [Sergentomyia squamirostris]